VFEITLTDNANTFGTSRN